MGPLVDEAPSSPVPPSLGGVLEFHENIEATLQQISQTDLSRINAIRDSLKGINRSPGETEEETSEAGFRNLDDALGALDAEVQGLARSILDWAAHAAADQQTHHMVHFSWAPAAGVIYCLSHYIPPDAVQAFTSATVSHLQTLVPELVQRNSSDPAGDGTQLASLPGVPREAQELNKLLTATEKATSSVLQGSGRGRDVVALAQAVAKARTALSEAGPAAVIPPPLFKKIPFQLKYFWELHMRGHSCADQLFAFLKAKLDEAEMPFKVAASGYLASALAKVATHLERLDAAVNDARDVLTQYCEQFRDKSIEECLARPQGPSTPTVFSFNFAADSPEQRAATEGRKTSLRRNKNRKAQASIASPVKDLDTSFKEAEGNQVSQGPATPRAEAGEEVKSPYGRADSSCEDEPAPAQQVPAALPAAGLDTAQTADAVVHAPQEAAAPNEGFKTELANVAGSLRKVLTSRGTESTEASSWSILEATSSALGSPVPTPMSHSSEEIHPDFHLIDDLNCPLKKTLMKDPVVAADGWTYEKSAILEYFEKQSISPMTHKPFPHTNLVPNLMARSMLQKLMMAQRRRKI